jgi:hypothetical protein
MVRSARDGIPTTRPGDTDDLGSHESTSFAETGTALAAALRRCLARSSATPFIGYGTSVNPVAMNKQEP